MDPNQVGFTQTLPLEQIVQQIQTRADFIAFVGALLVDLKDRPNDWENCDFGDFLEAMKAWVEDMDGYFGNIGEAAPDQTN